MSYDASDPQQVREAEAKAKDRGEEAKLILQNIMSLPQGRAWLWGLLARCHIYESCFGPDDRTTAFALGERNVGLRLQAEIIEASPTLFMQMLKERAHE